MSIKEWRPIFIENSKVPIILSKVAPINIWAISFGIWVWCRGELSEQTKRHETIHYQQQLELLFVFQWILYGLFYLAKLAKHKNGAKAYRANPFEEEAYANDPDPEYLKSRKRFNWINYM